ncbi:pyridoxal phosphate-dependent aminotransferase [Paludibacterium paludis]|uniref:Putative 8-amino-7-oxononanoate synthase n=1 Tax=Paludibacterium paludis TaxID=1225769 RepID=A0A918NZ05_9NEIS|nr:aminotransferase class I/II-fold pyridoxal phosphate-dependent enzyme [Paludibacterium paludis]GGY06536.1 putative aminotransferase [Paludibacterium paludis]
MLLVDLTENPLGLSPSARSAVLREVSCLHAFPDGAADALRHRLAAHLRLPARCVLPGAGSSDVLGMALSTLVSGHSRLICPALLPPHVETLVNASGLSVERVREADGWQPSLDSLARAVCGQDDAPIVYLPYPDSLGGGCHDSDELAAWLRAQAGRAVTIVDESYIEFYDGHDALSMVSLVREGMAGMLVLRSFSHAYGLAGVRAGYGLGDSALVGACARRMRPYPISLPALAACLDALDNPEWLSQSRLFVRVVRDFLGERLSAMQAEVRDCGLNFLLHRLEVPEERLAGALTDAGWPSVRRIGGMDGWARVGASTIETAGRYLEVLDRCRSALS